MAETHVERIARMRRSYREAHDRFVSRLSGAPVDLVERVPPDGGWSAAQIGWHVATVDAAPVAVSHLKGRGIRPHGQACAFDLRNLGRTSRDRTLGMRTSLSTRTREPRHAAYVAIRVWTALALVARGIDDRRTLRTAPLSAPGSWG